MKIVTFACDRYADIAPAWWHLFKANWPDCPYQVVFVSNERELDVPGPCHYFPGEDMSFGWRLRRFLKDNYTEEHLLIMMIDYLIKSVVPDMITLAHELCATNYVRHVRLRPMPHPQLPFDVPGLGKIDKDARYSLSLQPGIWESRVLYELCDDRWNPFQCEIQGSLRARRIPGDFLSTRKPAISHHNYYRKGRPSGVDWVMASVPEEAWPDAARKERVHG